MGGVLFCCFGGNGSSSGEICVYFLFLSIRPGEGGKEHERNYSQNQLGKCKFDFDVSGKR